MIRRLERNPVVRRLWNFWRILRRWRPKPVAWVRKWRWKRVEAKRVEPLAGYRTPAQVCPRGCEFKELARRDLEARTRLIGRADLRVNFVFETTNCPKCGVRLARHCARCGHNIYSPVEERCQFCGLPQPWAFERREAAERASVRFWHPDSDDDRSTRTVNQPAERLYEAPLRGDLWVLDGDITKLAVNAVVSNDDVDGQMWADTARAIKLAAGSGVEVLAQADKPYAVGQAWLTSAGALDDVEAIIHVASMTRNGESSIRSVKKALLSAYRLAAGQGYNSIGLGAMGSGPAAIPTSEWFRGFAEVSVAFFSDDSRKWKTPLSVVLVLFERDNFDSEVHALRRAVSDAWNDLDRPASGAPPLDFDHSVRHRVRRIRKTLRQILHRVKRRVPPGLRNPLLPTPLPRPKRVPPIDDQSLAESGPPESTSR